MMLRQTFHYLWSKFFWRKAELTNLVDRSSDHVVTDQPTVTIIIPTRDRADLLQNCLNSIHKLTEYENFEILLMDNDSMDKETIRVFEAALMSGHRVVKHRGLFNFSKIINAAAKESQSQYICFLNNDVEVISSKWLSHLVDHASRPGVGVVGSLLTYPDGRIQHAGVALGFSGVAAHAWRGAALNDAFHPSRDSCFEVSAVTFAAAVVRRDIFAELGGLDEGLRVGLNDVDFCIRAAKAGYKNILCWRSHLTHLESQSRPGMLSISGFCRAVPEVLRFMQKHEGLSNDPYFSRKITR